MADKNFFYRLLTRWIFFISTHRLHVWCNFVVNSSWSLVESLLRQTANLRRNVPVILFNWWNKMEFVVDCSSSTSRFSEKKFLTQNVTKSAGGDCWGVWNYLCYLYFSSSAGTLSRDYVITGKMLKKVANFFEHTHPCIRQRHLWTLKMARTFLAPWTARASHFVEMCRAYSVYFVPECLQLGIWQCPPPAAKYALAIVCQSWPATFPCSLGISWERVDCSWHHH